LFTTTYQQYYQADKPYTFAQNFRRFVSNIHNFVRFNLAQSYKLSANNPTIFRIFAPDMKKIGLLPRIIIAIVLDSFGTACNVTGDGALAVITDRLHKKR
jgi:hypothetical protein